MTTVFTTQIEIDANGVAWIGGTRVKVIEVIVERMAHGWSPEEVHFQHPHLSLAQIHGALTYYYENQEEIDAQIQRRLHEADQLASSVSDPEFRRRMRSLKPDR
ncbi:MAG: DUF433 domain-containing protein [Bryobacteraceae bacterium]